jgi:hypothetical protein
MKTKQTFRVTLRINLEGDKLITEHRLKRQLDWYLGHTYSQDLMSPHKSEIKVTDVIELPDYKVTARKP